MKKYEKKGYKSFFVYVIGVLGLSVLLTACATPNIAVIDPQSIFDRSIAGQRAQKGLRELIDSQQEIVSRDQEQLKEREQLIQDDTNELTTVQRQEKRRLLDIEVQQHQRNIQQVNQDIATKQREVEVEYLQKIEQSIQTIAKEKNVKIVLHKGSESSLKVVLYHDANVDLTEAVLEEFDRQFN